MNIGKPFGRGGQRIFFSKKPLFRGAAVAKSGLVGLKKERPFDIKGIVDSAFRLLFEPRQTPNLHLIFNVFNRPAGQNFTT